MPLTSSTLKTTIKATLEAEFGTVGTEPSLTAQQAHDLHAQAIAKAVVQWINANGIASVTGVTSGGATATLTATDDL